MTAALRTVIAFAVLFAAAQLHAVCNAKAQLQPDGTITVTLLDCANVTVTPGTAFTIDAGGLTIPVEATKAVSDPLLGTLITTSVVTPGTAAVAALSQGQAAITVKIAGQTITGNIAATFTDYQRWHWALGPATKQGATPATPDAAGGGVPIAGNGSAGAFRLQYNGEVAKGRAFGSMNQAFQTVASLSIDTTDQRDRGFIDNNRASFGVQWTRISAGRVLKQGRLGFEGHLSKAVHRDVRDADAVVTFAGWLPIVPTLNVLNTNGDFIAPPLSFELSYGYRNRHMQGDTFDGKVFEASALYNIFAANRWNVELSGTLTVDDLTNRPAATPRTQRMYKATIAYLQNPEKGFSIMTTIEDGSAGVMLVNVRQYFIGVALSKIRFSGGNS